ncbi:MAG: alpha-galactosidase, partial [Oscillospiraceae bacterium]|nr:alpha-galactosidase [Oscillospiraceae bacterium]
HTPCGPGTIASGSRTGSSSNRANPFVMLRGKNADETNGPCYGFHLTYSGGHYACACGNGYGKLRFLHGIQPEGFSWLLGPGDSFTAPEAAMTFGWGLDEMSAHFHTFVQEHIVRGQWKKRPRPVLVNSWESFYFRFTQKDLLRLARQGRDLGAELFVLDDGWFGKRDNDACSLGDWDVVNRKKLPNGLDGLAREVRELGIGFGLWVEPEMVSGDSRLYRAHPDWILGRPGQAMGRNQYILDLSRREVQDHLIRVLSEVFTQADPAYVKWDMNRIMTDTYSSALPPQRQGEVRHRYILGLYRVLEALTARFPKILFEACASGGNRTDLGMLCYMPQVWLSDNTDALCRCRIQYNASFGYPQSVMGAHVSAVPNHQTLRSAPLDSRFHVAAFGLLGYELDLCGLSEKEKTRVAGQIAFYKRYRETLQFGRLHRLRGGEDGLWQLMAVSGDRGEALALLFQQENRPNAPALRLLARGLDPETVYRLTVRPAPAALKDFGSLVNMISPVRIRPGSLTASAADKLVRLPGERETLRASGDVLNRFGAWLKQGFSGTGYDGETRVMGDSGSRLYILEREDDTALLNKDAAIKYCMTDGGRTT